MKYRLIIADDERKIIELIKQLGHWEELNIEIVDECTNGREAYESIRENKPDFVLSDIKMPVYDGIELIQKLRDEGVNPFFVLLSGYRHFEYARSAIQLNVIDYLLKPIDEEQLNRTLKRACICVEEARMQKEESGMLSAWKNDRDMQKREDFWKIFMETSHGERTPGEWNLKNIWKSPAFPYSAQECAELFHMDFPHDCFQMLCIFSDLSSILGHTSSAGNKKVEDFIQECMQKKAVTYYHTTYMGYIILLNYEEEQAKEVRQAVCALYYHILDLSELYGEIRLNIGVSARKKSLSGLMEAFQEAHDSEWGRLVYTGNGILDYEQIDRLPRCGIQDIVLKEETEQIRDAVKYLKPEKAGEAAQTVYKRCGTYNSYSPRAFLLLFFYLENMMMEFITDKEKRERFRENYYYAYLNAGNYQQVVKGAFLVLMQYVEEERKQLREKMDKPVSMAVQYMKEHYREQISLEDAAAAGNVSPNYLSKLFRSEMGVGFLDYLTQIRLKESERLLEETNLSIREIAAKVGYLDEKYYSKLFKKATGIKPSEYRRIYS